MSKVVIILITVGIAYWLGRNLYLAKVKTIIKNSAAKITPSITLIPQEKLVLKNAGEFESRSRELQNLGFILDGNFSVQEMPGVMIAGYVNPATSLYASVYEHPRGLHWVEIKGEYSDGTVIYASNAPTGDQFDALEGYIKISDKTATAATLLQKIHDKGKPLPFKAVAKGSFKTNFEQSYIRFAAKFKKKEVSKTEVNRFVERK